MSHHPAAIADSGAAYVLDPTRLAIGARGYWIQSQILHTPDRLGYFSPGPLPLQEWQGWGFIRKAFFLYLLLVLQASGLFIVRPAGRLLWKFVIFSAAADLFIILFSWGCQLLEPRRAPDYDWGKWALLQLKDN